MITDQIGGFFIEIYTGYRLLGLGGLILELSWASRLTFTSRALLPTALTVWEYTDWKVADGEPLADSRVLVVYGAELHGVAAIGHTAGVGASVKLS